jgi:hypothetical protein
LARIAPLTVIDEPEMRTAPPPPPPPAPLPWAAVP